MTQNTAQDRIRHFPCESCGADLQFEPGTTELSCAYCGFSVPITLDESTEIVERDLEGMLARQVLQRETTLTPDDLEIRCPSCYATIVFRGTLTAQSCPYCTSPLQRSDVHRAEDRAPVDALLPFKVEAEEARAALADWLKGRWFAPKAFTHQAAPSQLQSLYLPYWTFDAITSTRYKGRRKKQKQTFWRTRKGSFQWIFDDMMVRADQSIPSASLKGLRPWPLDDSVPYQPEYLTGHLAKTYDLPLTAGWKQARVRMEKRILQNALSEIGGDTQQIDELQTRWEALTYKHILVPVYVVSLRHKGKSHRIWINGATRRVTGERPWSLEKIAAVGVALFVLGRLASHFAVSL